MGFLSDRFLCQNFIVSAIGDHTCYQSYSMVFLGSLFEHSNLLFHSSDGSMGEEEVLSKDIYLNFKTFIVSHSVVEENFFIDQSSLEVGLFAQISLHSFL